MANDNETVEQVCDWLKERDLPFAASIAEVKYANPSYDAESCLINALKNLADRIEAAAHNNPTCINCVAVEKWRAKQAAAKAKKEAK